MGWNKNDNAIGMTSSTFSVLCGHVFVQKRHKYTRLSALEFPVVCEEDDNSDPRRRQYLVDVAFPSRGGGMFLVALEHFLITLPINLLWCLTYCSHSSTINADQRMVPGVKGKNSTG